MSKIKKRSMLTALLLLICFGCVCFLSGCNESNKGPTNKEIKECSIKELKNYVQYPLTFELIDFNIDKDNSTDFIYFDVSGNFKSSNAFGVYQQHKFQIVFIYFIKDERLDLVITQIDGETYYVG